MIFSNSLSWIFIAPGAAFLYVFFASRKKGQYKNGMVLFFPLEFVNYSLNCAIIESAQKLCSLPSQKRLFFRVAFSLCLIF
jgi:hypothetical protein